METNKKLKMSNMMLAFITLLFVIAVVALVGFFILTPDEEVIQGQAEATEIRISGKVPGRIASYKVVEGQAVKAGDTLVLFDSPEIAAKLLQAQAAEDAAQAQNQKAIKGARDEQITAAYEMWQKAKAGLDIAEKSYERVQRLHDKGVMTAQKRDEAKANYAAMQATEKAAKSQYNMAKNGAEREDKLAAEAMVNRAKGAVAEVESYLKETVLTAPSDGEVSEIFPKRGELVGTGAPVMHLIDLNDMWVTFNVREDLLSRFKMGAEFQAIVPALEEQAIVLKVTYLKDMGTYAAWKATKTTGQYDLKTFEVRAKPAKRIDGLRPGMSVIVK